MEALRIRVNGGRARRKESGEGEEGKKEDDAVAFDFERTAEMQRVSAARFRSDGGDRFEAVHVK